MNPVLPSACFRSRWSFSSCKAVVDTLSTCGNARAVCSAESFHLEYEQATPSSSVDSLSQFVCRLSHLVSGPSHHGRTGRDPHIIRSSMALTIGSQTFKSSCSARLGIDLQSITVRLAREKVVP